MIEGCIVKLRKPWGPYLYQVVDSSEPVGHKRCNAAQFMVSFDDILLS